MALFPAARARPLAGLKGQWQNMENQNSFTGHAGAAIAFGQAVMKGSGDNAYLPLVTGNKFAGISLENITTTGEPVNGDPRYGVGDIFGIADEGVIFVDVGAAVVKGNSVWYLPSTGLYYAATGTGRMLLPGCEFDQSGAPGAAVPVKIRLVPGSASITAAA